MTDFLVTRCNRCQKPSIIGHSIIGEWKGYPTQRNYCTDCCKVLKLSIDQGPIEQRIDEAIAYFLGTGKIFTRSQVYARAGTYKDYLVSIKDDYSEVIKRVDMAVRLGLDYALEASLEYFQSLGERFSIQDVCDRAGLSPVSLSMYHRAWHQRIKEASIKSKPHPRRGKAGITKLDRQYRAITNPEQIGA